MLSYADTMVKIWRCLEQVASSDVQNSHISHVISYVITCEISEFWTSDDETYSKHFQFFTIVSTYDIMMSCQVSWFSDYVWIFYNWKILLPHRDCHLAWTRPSNFWVGSCTWSKNTLFNMNIIFRMAAFDYFMHLQFKFGLCEKMQGNKIII